MGFALMPVLGGAQYTGPGAHGTKQTIAYVKEHASSLDKSDALVQLSGFIVEKVTKQDYLFADATGKMLVEISKKVLPLTPFDHKTKITLVGEVDYDLFEEVEFEVKEIIIQ